MESSVSLGKVSRVPRTPITRWQRPEDRILLEKRHKGGEPPFVPFPSVQTVLNAAICPVAAVHDLLYGIDNAMVKLEEGEFGVGDLFQDYIAHLKYQIKKGAHTPGRERTLYEVFAGERSEETKLGCWEYLQQWLRRKKDELSGISAETDMFFEVHVASPELEIPLGDGKRTYYLHGKIDELDITNKRIIERTTKGFETDPTPPRFKDFQVWLLWKALASLKKDQCPKLWKDEKFADYDLVVETPYKDFQIDKHDPRFPEMAHDAFAWINDITKDPSVVKDAWDNRACTYNDQSVDCGLTTHSCYMASRKHPLSRKAMHAALRRYYRGLLYEQLWTHHLFLYQLTKLPQDTLQSMGKIIPGTVKIEKDGNLTLVVSGNTDPMTELKADEDRGDKTEFKIVFGTFFLGLQRTAKVKNIDSVTKRISLDTRKNEPLPDEARILLSEGLLFQEAPWFLKRHIQRGMFRLEKWGLDVDAKAKRHSVIQMEDALFGSSPSLKRSGRRGESEASR